MVFSSITFLFYFLPFVLLATYTLPWRNAVLLASGLLFYAWGDARDLPVLLACIAINYAAGLFVARPGRVGRWALGTGVGGDLALLFAFKYSGFIGQQIGVALPHPGLPLGISFFTFQGISYLVDIRRGIVPPQRSLLKFAAFKAMFPPLIAGPIVRYAEIAKQLEQRKIIPEQLRAGVEAFCVGLAQKVLLANTLAGPVDKIFAADPTNLSALAAWTGAVGYALQIYFDFCGYSNMAIGLGRMLGFELPQNFNLPYASRSLTEFWRRWHMTLSRWFRDYLYIPLGGSRVSAPRVYGNLFTVFLLCGLWHGASWNFAVWGLYHGAFLATEHAARRSRVAALLRRVPAFFRHVYLLVVVVIGWTFFRIDTFGSAWRYLHAMFGASPHAVMTAADFVTGSMLAALAIGSVLSVWDRWPAVVPDAIRPAAAQAGYIALLFLSACSLAAGTYNPFIYFRF